MTTALVLVGCIVVVAVLAGLVAASRSRPGRPVQRPRPQRPASRPASVSPPAALSPALPPSVSRPIVTALQREVLRSRIDAEEERQQVLLRDAIFEHSQRLDRALRSARQTVAFEEMRGLHRESARLANDSHNRLGTARRALSTIISSQTDVHSAMSAHGRTSEMTSTLDSLAAQRAAMTSYVDQYKIDRDRLNRQTGLLRDRLSSDYGEPGRAWRRDFDQRKAQRIAARQQGDARPSSN